MDQGWWTDTAVCTSSEDSSELYPHGQTENCLRLWYCSSFNQPDYSATHWIQSLLVFLFFSPFSSCFTHHLWVCQCVCECVCMWVCFSQNTVQVVGKRGTDRQMCKPTGIWIHHTPTHTHTHVTGLNHCTVCGTELYASHKTSAGFSLHLHADTLYNVLVLYSLLIHRTRLGKLLQKIRIYFVE